MPFNFPSFGQNKFLPFNPVVKKQIGQNPFGMGLDPYKPDNQLQPAPQPQEQPSPNFADEYAKATANRPQRLAYQQAVTEGPPQIDRGKWAKLGAVLAAGATGLGQNSATAGMNLGLSAYQEPQLRSDANYKQKVSGLGNLANMEDSDIQEKIKALEFQHKDYYDQQENTRQNQAEERAKLMTNANIRNIESEMKKRDTDAYDDENTGWHYEIQNGRAVPLYKNKQTPEEKARADANATKLKEAELEPGRKARDAADSQRQAASDASHNAGSLAVAQEGTSRANSVANIKANQQAAALRQKALTSTGQAKQQELDLADAIDKEPALKGFNLGEIIEKVGGVYKVKDIGEGTIWDDPAVIAARDRVKAVLEKSNTTKPGVVNAPNPAANPLPPGFSVRGG